MTPEQRKLLEPFGNQLCDWEIRIAEMSLEELASFEVACNSVTPTNVWYCIYDAAQILKRIINARRTLSKRVQSG